MTDPLSAGLIMILSFFWSWWRANVSSWVMLGTRAGRVGIFVTMCTSRLIRSRTFLGIWLSLGSQSDLGVNGVPVESESWSSWKKAASLSLLWYSRISCLMLGSFLKSNWSRVGMKDRPLLSTRRWAAEGRKCLERLRTWFPLAPSSGGGEISLTSASRGPRWLHRWKGASGCCRVGCGRDAVEGP